MFNYMVQVSWEDEDGATDFCDYAISAADVQTAKAEALEMAAHNGRESLEINSVWVQVE